MGTDSDILVDHAALGQKTIHKGVRITYVGKDVSNISFLVRQRLEGQNQRVYHFPSEEIARKYMRHESDRVLQEAFVLPDKALADELITAYFTYVNPGCPILNEDTFMAQYGGQNPADPPSLLILQAVLLVGAHVSKDRPERDTLKAAFFRRAKMLFDARVEWNRDFMVQAALLLTWYSDGVEDVTANAWFWVGTAARIATGRSCYVRKDLKACFNLFFSITCNLQAGRYSASSTQDHPEVKFLTSILGLGMHRDTSSSSLTLTDKRRWRRTWWILFQHDVTVSLFYGRPPAM